MWKTHPYLTTTPSLCAPLDPLLPFTFLIPTHTYTKYRIYTHNIYPINTHIRTTLEKKNIIPTYTLKKSKEFKEGQIETNNGDEEKIVRIWRDQK